MARTAPVPNIPPIPGMCPSVAVMGGGGGGGGGSGDGDGNGDGNGNGNGNGNGDGAEGDGNGSGSCGNGSPGSCTNCSSGTSAGDPVDCVTGEVFTVPKTDLFLPGPFNLEIERHYSSFNRRQDVGLGWGWVHSLAWRGEIRRALVVIRTGTGQLVEFPRLNPGESFAVQGWGLLRTTEGYVLRAGDEFMHVFVPAPDSPDVLLLRRIELRNRGALDITYDRGQMTRLTDSAGRTVLFSRDGDGRLTSISVPDPTGQSIVFARYRYDGGGNLVEAVDADGHAWLYAYDDDRRLVRMTIPRGPVFHFHYDLHGRCVETYGLTQDGAPDPALTPDAPALLADGVTKAKGIYHVKLTFSEDGHSESVDSVRVQRYLAGPGGKTARATNGRGAVTSRRFDAQGNIASHTDANGSTWHYKYNDLGDVIESVDPEGGTVRFERDGEGRITKVIDPLGGTIEYGLDRYGNVEWARDQRGSVNTLRYDARGLLREQVAGDGSRMRFERDGHGNVTAIILPNGAVQRFRYDYWGRLIHETLPDGREFSCRYSPSGRLLEVTDSAGRTKTAEYDPLGNLTSDKLPDGSVTRYDYGGLGWLRAVRYPDGSSVKRYFNREGWLVRLENERGERHELTYNASGAVVKEQTFDGVVRSLTRDRRDYIVRIAEPDGAYDVERNRLGLPVKVTPPRGPERSFAYDAAGRLTLAADSAVTVRWERDAAGAVLAEAITVRGITHEVKTIRDILGRRIGLTTSVGHILESTRDALGEVALLRADGTDTERIARDATGWPVRREFPSGGGIADDHDAAGRLRRRVVIHPAASAPPSAGEPDWIGERAGHFSAAYQYTPVDEVASVTTTTDGTVEYEYDVRRNMLARRGRAGAEEFSYDQLGNPYERGADAPLREYEAGSRLVRRGRAAYDHDRRGRVIAKREKTDDGSERTTRYSYDDWDLLASVELPDGRRIENVYDSFARRVEKRELSPSPDGKLKLARTTRYVWGLASVLHEIVEEPGKSTVNTTFLYEDEGEVVPLAHRSPDGKWFHYVHALNGTPEKILDDGGNVVGSSRRTSYGRTEWEPSSRVTTPFRAPGQIEDLETGLFYNRYRTYDPEAGRYLSIDPLGLDGGFNLYAYGPNPIAWVDPMGWQHHMTVSGPRAWHDGRRPLSTDRAGTEYDSGFHGLPSNHELNSRARCHTEQRFAHDLINSGRRWDNERFTLTGELPPCPNCHRALQHAADRTGANITYRWRGSDGRMQSMTYRPNTAPTARGSEARELNAAYRMERDPTRRNGYRFTSWGSATSTYSNQSNDIAEADD